MAEALAVATFYLKTKPEILSRVKDELLTVVEDEKNLPQWSKLEKLPYFISTITLNEVTMADTPNSAMITETIRLSYGVATRLARIAPDQALYYSGTFKDKPVNYTIPPGAAIGMTSVIMHADENIFPQADEFIPERWLNKDGTRRTELERYLLSFSKGTRQCIGMK